MIKSKIGIAIMIFMVLTQITAGQDISKESGNDSYFSPRISGFLDASYFHSLRQTAYNIGYDQAEADIEDDLGQMANIRFDLEWSDFADGKPEFTLEQGYMTVKTDGLALSSITFGQFNAPIGCEASDTPEKTQCSYSLVSGYSSPGNLAGLMLYSQMSSTLGLTFFITNGWDQGYDLKKGRNLGGRLDFSGGENLLIGIAYIYGNETAEKNSKTAIYEMDGSYWPLERLNVGGNITYGKNILPSERSRWVGGYLMGYYSLTGWLGFTARYDYFNDILGTRLEQGLPVKLQSASIAPVISMPGGLKSLIEYRLDYSIYKSIPPETGSRFNSVQSTAFEVIFAF